MVGADEISHDAILREKTLNLFETIESSATATTIMFPHVPTLGLLKRTYAGGRLYMIFKDIIDKRKATGEKHDDPLQYLIDKGDSPMKIIKFILGSLFAGQLNSGVNAAWVLCYLAKDSYWLGRVLEDIRAVTAKYSKNRDLPLSAQLADVPIEAWESEFPSVDICLRESIRLSLVGTAFRKNVTGKNVPIMGTGEVIPPNAFVTYATSDVHLNPDFYRDPEKWDPSRYLPERAEDKKREHGYLGWGTGRHPCLGMRFAKLEQNIITAYFIAEFEFELTDKNGRPLPTVPKVDFNAYSATKPNPPMYLKYRLREK
jgi:sterol 14-demethylase